MDPTNSSKTTEESADKGGRRFRPLRNLFLLDVLRDKESQPAIIWALSTLLIGTLFYHRMEGWSYLDSLYFSVVSLGTVGYGDLTPTTPITKIFTIVYLINGIVILLSLFDRIRIVRSRQHEKVYKHPDEN
jgi:hypothetical protein